MKTHSNNICLYNNMVLYRHTSSTTFLEWCLICPYQLEFLEVLETVRLIMLSELFCDVLGATQRTQSMV